MMPGYAPFKSTSYIDFYIIIILRIKLIGKVKHNEK